MRPTYTLGSLNNQLILCIASTAVFISDFQDRYSLFALQPFEHLAHSPSPRRTSRNNPRPYFHECMQNDVTTALHSWYWLNYWHILISKGMSGFTSNTLLIRIHYIII